MRPDLFDPHTVHFHGFPNAASVFDGVPEVSIAISHGATLTYYYNIVQAGTFIYHCHVEATEHMEMGMLANLYVHPKQDANRLPEWALSVATRKGGTDVGAPTGYAYNDDDGTTALGRREAHSGLRIRLDFHDASVFIQPLPFSELEANYPMINGRGYPDTIRPGNLRHRRQRQPGRRVSSRQDHGVGGEILNNGTPTQTLDSVISLTQGQKLLLRLSNVSIDRFYTLTAQGSA